MAERTRGVYKPDIINVLRVVAALFVFLLHGRSYIEGIDSSNNPLMFLTCLPAWAGVWIFLFLSSYLMGVGFVSNKYDIFDDTGNLVVSKLWHFYVKRFLRIAPMYYGYCILFELFSGQNFFSQNPGILLKMLTFTFNGNGGIIGIGHLWYISLAMQIYLIVPFIYILIVRIKNARTDRLAFLLLLAGGFALRIILWKVGADWYTWVYTFLFFNLDIVICGMLLAKINTGRKEKAVSRKGMNFCCVVQFVALVAYNCYIYSHSEVALYMEIYRYALPTLYILSCSILILQFQGSKKEKQEQKNIFAVIDWFAPYTFAFYIFHIQTFVYFSNTFANKPWFSGSTLFGRYVMFFGITFLINVVISVLFTIAIESKPNFFRRR